MTSVVDLLVGQECPECEREIEARDLRFEGWRWAHKSERAQAGHHGFDVLDAIDADGDFSVVSVEEEREETVVMLATVEVEK